MSFVDTKVEGLSIKNEEGHGVEIKYEAEQNIALQASSSWEINGVPADTLYYYEVAVKSTKDAVALGLAGADFPTVKVMPGWEEGSYAYHGDDGKRYVEGRGKGDWPTFGKDDLVGIGLKVSTGEMFGTLNGKFQGVVASITEKTPLFPTIGFTAPSEIEVFFDKKHHKFDLSTLPETLIPSFGCLEGTDMNSPKFLVLYTTGVDDAQRAHLQGQLEGAAKIAKPKYGFQSLYTKETEGIAKAIREFTGVHERSPLLVAVDTSKGKKYAIPEGEPITTETILKLLEDIEAKKIESLKKSAIRTPGDKHPKCPTLVQVVGTSFDELVIGGNKDVLLDVYADWCGPCRSVAPTIDLLSEIFADNSNIVIAKIDCDANDLDRTYLPETSIPNIKLFPGANKKEPIKYSGNRTLENFLEFLHTNATVKFDLEAAKEKGKKLKAEAEKKALKNVIHVHSAEEFKSHLASDKLVIVDYFATWCGPCVHIAPKYADLSEEFSAAVFLKVDVDGLKEVAKEQDIQCMPTFKAYKKGVEVGKLEGADPKALKKLVEDNL